MSHYYQLRRRHLIPRCVFLSAASKSVINIASCRKFDRQNDYFLYSSHKKTVVHTQTRTIYKDNLHLYKTLHYYVTLSIFYIEYEYPGVYSTVSKQ